jgi:hypothetical protein
MAGRRTDPRVTVREANKEIKAPFRAIHALERLMIDGAERTDQQILKKCPEFNAEELNKARMLLVEVGILRQIGVNNDSQLIWELNDERREELEAERFPAAKTEKPKEEKAPPTNGHKPRRPRKKALTVAIEEIVMALDKVAHMRGKEHGDEVKKTLAWLETLTSDQG